MPIIKPSELENDISKYIKALELENSRYQSSIMFLFRMFDIYNLKFIY